MLFSPHEESQGLALRKLLLHVVKFSVYRPVVELIFLAAAGAPLIVPAAALPDCKQDSK
jgi:hypothetical protein